MNHLLERERQPILRIEQLHIEARVHKSNQPIVKDISLDIYKGEMVSLVGESGSGKSVTASAIAGLLPTALTISEGKILFQGTNLVGLPIKQRKQLLGKHIGYVFQDYQGSFTPFIRIGNQLTEIVRTHMNASRREAQELVMGWLERMALPADRVYTSYPFQLSGGQRQRVALAAAIMLKPSLLIADEPTTALDMITGNTILNLMKELQAQTGCAVLFISHDLRQVMHRSQRIAIMKEGKIVEVGDKEQIRHRPVHAYTQMLLNASPRLIREREQRVSEKELVLIE